MLDIYFWPTPNGHKVLMFTEEAGLPYNIKPVNISAGDQFEPDFLRISPNNRMPALVDHAPADGGESLSVFESGAILLYLADKMGHFIPQDLRGRNEVIAWLFWQMAGLGPMLGQNHHFRHYAPEKISYAIQRYEDETNRLYGVLDTQLEGREFIHGDDYSIADMAAYPWVIPHIQGQDIEEFPNLKRWKEAIAARPATVRAYEKGKAALSSGPVVTDAGKKILFGQRASSLRQRKEACSV